MASNGGAIILLSGPRPLSAEPGGRGVGRLLYDLEEGVAAAFLDRLAADGAPPADAEVMLRAAVLARAGVGVLRAIRLTHLRLPEAERAALDLADFTRRAFAALTGPPASG